jgi:hypothetical protein
MSRADSPPQKGATALDKYQVHYWRGLTLMGLLAWTEVVGLVSLCLGLICVSRAPDYVAACGLVGVLLSIGGYTLYRVLCSSGIIGAASASDGLVRKRPWLKRLKPLVILTGILAVAGAFFGGVSFDDEPHTKDSQSPLVTSPATSEADVASNSEPAPRRKDRLTGPMFWLVWLSTPGVIATLGLYQLFYGRPYNTLFGLIPKKR